MKKRPEEVITENSLRQLWAKTLAPRDEVPAGVGMTVRELADMLGKPSRTVRDMVARRFQEGRITFLGTRNGSKVYDLTEKPAQKGQRKL